MSRPETPSHTQLNFRQVHDDDRTDCILQTVGLRAVPPGDNGVSFPATGRRVGVTGKGNEVLGQKGGQEHAIKAV